MDQVVEKPRLDEAEATEMLRIHGITPTQQRVEIASILLARPQHLSAEELMKRVHDAGQAVSKATVYNTLALFAEHGLVREVIVDPTKVFYDSNIEPHHHFYDRDSGRLTDIGQSEIALSHLPPPPTGTELDSVEVIVRVRKTSA